MNLWQYYLLKSPLRASQQVVVIMNYDGREYPTFSLFPCLCNTLDITCDTSSLGTNPGPAAQFLIYKQFWIIFKFFNYQSDPGVSTKVINFSLHFWTFHLRVIHYIKKYMMENWLPFRKLFIVDREKREIHIIIIFLNFEMAQGA